MKGTSATAVRRFYEFGPFRLDLNRHRLFRDGEFIPLSGKAIEILTLLVQNPGKLLQREALMEALWPDVIVEDANLTVAVSQLRKAINENGDLGEFIQTIPRVGYRFIAEVRDVEEQPSLLVSESAATDVDRKAAVPEVGLGNGATSEPARPPPAERQIGAAFLRTWIFRNPRIVTPVLVIFGVLGLTIYWRTERNPKPPATAAEVKSMAVLPLQTLGVKSDDEYLGLGLADALINQLGRVRQVTIRPLSAVERYAGPGTRDPLAVGRQLGVEAVLEGTVQHDGDKLRVMMRLLRVADGVALWSGRFDDKFIDIFALQDSISEQVAEASVLNLSSRDKELLTKRHTDNIQAYHFYLKGRYFWNKRTQAGLKQGLGYFKQAIELDPTYALAYAGLADTYAQLVWEEERPQEQFIPLAKAAAMKALEIDETLGEAHASLGFVKFWYDWDFVGAESEFRRAIELNPDYATAHHWYGEFLGLMGRFDEGFQELRLAQEADPLSLMINSDIGKLFLFTRQADGAIEQLQKTLEMEPDFPVARLFLALAYNQKGMHEQGITEIKKLTNDPGCRCMFTATLGYLYAQAGRKEEALNVVRQLTELRSSQRFVPPFGIALVYAGLGQKEQALEWLTQAKVEHDPFFLYARTDPNFDLLRGESLPPVLFGSK